MSLALSLQGGFLRDIGKALLCRERGPAGWFFPKLPQTGRAEGGFCNIPNSLMGLICLGQVSLCSDGLEAPARVRTHVLIKEFLGLPGAGNKREDDEPVNELVTAAWRTRGRR